MSQDLILSLPGAVIRPYAPADAAALVRNANDPLVAANMRHRFPHPYTDADAAAWIALSSTRLRATQFTIAVSGETAGGIGLERMDDVHAGTAEIGYWLGREHWGRGLGTAAVKAVTRYGFEALGLVRVHAMVFSWNPASSRVLEKAGYAFEGRMRQHVRKNGETGDVLVYAQLADAPR